MRLDELNQLLASVGLKPMHLSPIFYGKTLPLRNGVYQVLWVTYPVYSKFKDGVWFVGNFNSDEAAKEYRSSYDKRPVWWRGVQS